MLKRASYIFMFKFRLFRDSNSFWKHLLTHIVLLGWCSHSHLPTFSVHTNTAWYWSGSSCAGPLASWRQLANTSSLRRSCRSTEHLLLLRLLGLWLIRLEIHYKCFCTCDTTLNGSGFPECRNPPLGSNTKKQVGVSLLIWGRWRWLPIHSHYQSLHSKRPPFFVLRHLATCQPSFLTTFRVTVDGAFLHYGPVRCFLRRPRQVVNIDARSVMQQRRVGRSNVHRRGRSAAVIMLVACRSAWRPFTTQLPQFKKLAPSPPYC
jgi:hypothetical protein